MMTSAARPSIIYLTNLQALGKRAMARYGGAKAREKAANLKSKVFRDRHIFYAQRRRNLAFS